jgi:glycosyltransferase involved in cell wall biosynthesis
MTPLLDLHHLGMRQTGNESWARGLAAALFELDGPGSYDIAVTKAARADDLKALPARERVLLSGRSSWRLGLDLPLAMRRLHTPVVLVQYTAPLSPVPAVVAVHDLSFEDPRAAQWLPLASRLRYRATVRASVWRAAHLLAVSACTRDDLIARYGVEKERISVVPAAVDPHFKQLLETMPEDRTGPPTVLVVGNVLPRKNLSVVVRAVRLMRDRGSDVRLRVVGTVHPTGRADAALADRLLGDAVELSGYVSREQLARELRSAHVLAFPSLFEGFGVPVLEAMVAGLPVVVSDGTSLPEVVGAAGIIVPAGDPSAWAMALEDALGAAGPALVAKGRDRQSEFSWLGSAQTVSDLLARVSDGTAPAPR